MTVTQADVDAGSVTDTATATGTDTQGNTTPAASGTATVPAEPASPELSIVKHATVAPSADQNDIKVGDKVHYSYTVTNTGDVTLAAISVSDPTLGPVTCPALTGPGLAPGDNTTTATINIAPAPATDLALSKSASPVMVDPGGRITYSLTVTNNGPGDSSGFALTDPLPAGVTGASTSSPGCSVSGQSVVCAGSPLAAGSSVTDTITVNAPDPFSGSVANTASVAANENDPVSGNNSASATVSANVPAVSVKKSAVVTPASDQGGVQVGDSIQYGYLVTNTGNTPLVSVAVSDSSAGHVTCPVPVLPGLAPGASVTCVADAPFVVGQSDVDAGSVIDSATATGTDVTGLVSPASTPSMVVVPAVAAAPGLSVVKVADASSGDSAPVSVGETIQYSYVVTNTGNVDLGSVSVSDRTAGSVTCPVLPSPGLAPGQSETCTADSPYSVTQAVWIYVSGHAG